TMIIANVEFHASAYRTCPAPIGTPCGAATYFSLRPLQNRKLGVLLGKRMRKIARIEERTGSSNPCSLEATFKNPFGCLHNYRRGDSIDVTSASRSTTLFPVFAANHLYQKDLCR